MKTITELKVLAGLDFSCKMKVDSDRFHKIRRSVYARNKALGDIEVLIDTGNEFKYSVFDILGLNDNIIHIIKE